MGVVHKNLTSKCCVQLMFNIHILFTSHKSWMNQDPLVESLHDTNPGMVLYATMRSPYSDTLVRDPGAAPGAGPYSPPNGLVSVPACWNWTGIPISNSVPLHAF